MGWVWHKGWVSDREPLEDLHGSPPQVPHNINFREKKPKPSKKKAEGGSTEEGAGARGRVARFRYFEDIYGYSGVGQRLCRGLW